MTRPTVLSIALYLATVSVAPAREAKLIRSPHYHDGTVVFSYLGDLWTARENGSNVLRLTAHKARDLTPRFAPDGKLVAFSSDREGNLDVFVIPAQGGEVKRLTTHSADDLVLGWTPDGKSVLFASQRGEGFMGKLYTVPAAGGLARDAGPDMGVYGCYSPDGAKLVVTRKAQPYWRKHYHGAYQSDVTLMDLATKTFKDLTDYDGMDSWPLWAKDGFIYFVSDRDAGQANFWRVPESGGAAERVTEFKAGEVRSPSLSSDGKTIVFERDHGVAKLDLASKQVTPLTFDIAAETQESLTEFKDVNSTVDDYDLAPDGKRIVFATHGEIFTAPTDEGELQQVTDGPFRDQNVTYSPDGKFAAFISDRSGREEIHVAANDGEGEPRKVTDVDALKSSYIWSPDSKTLAFTTSDDKLYTVSAEGKDLKELASSKYGDIGRPAWSPDGKWLAYDKPDVTRNTDIYLLPAAGGEERKVSFDSFDERNAQFSADSKKLYFLRVEGEFGNGQRPQVRLYCMPLEKIEKDPEEADAEATNPLSEMRRGGGAARSTPPKEPKIDWAGLKRRTRIVTRAATVSNYVPAHDGKTILFVGSEGLGGRGVAGGGGLSSIFSIQDDGKHMSRIASGTSNASDSEDDAPRRFRSFGGGSIRNLNLTRDGRTLYYQEGDGVYSASVSGGGGSGGFAALPGASRSDSGSGRGVSDSGSTLGGGGGSRKKVTFNVSVRIDKPKEWEEMFDDAWRTMKYRFYDPKMHGKDWDAARARYKPLVSYVADRHELMNVINEMIGELNASHTGASVGGGGGGGGAGTSTRHLGLDLIEDPSGYYKVSYVYEGGPADKDWIKVEPGVFLITLDGKPLRVGDDYWERLGRRINRKVELTLNAKPSAEGSWKVKYEPISSTAYAELRYDRWVKERRALTEKLSNGRVGYLHIKAMDQPSLAKFRKELTEFRHKEALVIDERFNGGGNIEQELLAILVQRPYQVWQPRGTEPTARPFTGYYGPKVVLQNWRSASNAEMFPAGFRALGLGKIVGTPTMGAVIGTGSYALIDGSSIRTPHVGVYLSDHDRTNMENHPVTPDITVENTPEDNLAGRDRQLEVAVQEILNNLKPGGDAGRN